MTEVLLVRITPRIVAELHDTCTQQNVVHVFRHHDICESLFFQLVELGVGLVWCAKHHHPEISLPHFLNPLQKLKDKISVDRRGAYIG